MSGICGWLEPVPVGDADLPLLAGMAGHLPYASRTQTDLHKGAAVAGSGSDDGVCARDGDRLAAIAGHPRWRNADLAELAHRDGHATALLEGYARHGEEVLTHLAGTFSLAILDSARQTAFLAIDRMGVGRLCFARTDAGGLAFGSSADCLRFHPHVDDGLSAQGVFNYLFHYVSPAPRTVYAAMEKLRAGHCLTWADGTSSVRRYWRIDYTADDSPDDAKLREQLVATMRDAVGRSVEGTDLERTGAFLSGGLDSSTTSGLLAEHSPGAAKTFTIGFDLEGFDESGFAAITARHFQTDHTLYYVTPEDVYDLVPNIARRFDEPFGNSSAIPAFFCAKVAHDKGIDTMIAGDGGDELFCGNERYLEHRKYEWFQHLPTALRQFALTSARLAPDSIRTVRRGRNYLNFLDTPLPDRLYYMVAQHGADLSDYFEADFATIVDDDEPVRIARELYNATDANLDVVQRMMLMDQQLTLADNDLRKVEGACEMAGVRVRYPFLDDELVAFSGTVPAVLHTKSGVLRDFFKRSFRDFLPAEVISKQKHGFGLPTGHWLRDHLPLRILCEESIAGFGERHVIRKDVADMLIEVLRDGSRPDLLGMSWDIMIFELWLQARSLSV